MENYHHLEYYEKKRLVDLLKSDTCKKKNGKISIRKIAWEIGRSPNIISRELKIFKNIEDYDARKAHEDYYKKRKKCIKKLPTFTEEQQEFLNLRFNTFYD